MSLNMVIYSHSKYRHRLCLAPESSAGGGGSPGNPAAQQGGGQAQTETVPVDPFAGMDLEDFDPENRQRIEKLKTEFASLQKKQADAETARQREENEKRQFQSRFDQLQLQVQKLNGGQQQTQADPKQQSVEALKQILLKRGTPEAQASGQAELLDEILAQREAKMREEIGRDLQPFAANVISREAEFAWHEASQSDRVGALTIPEVAEVVWKQVQEMTSHGQQVTAPVVTNLAGMAYFAHLQKGGASATTQQTQTQPPPVQQYPQVGRMSYPGSGAAASRPQVTDPSAARTSLDPSTDAALQVVFGKWANGQGGVKAPGYREPAKKGGR